jgi:hypothetical protein
MTIPAVKPRYILAVYLGLCFVFIVAAMNTGGDASIAMLTLVLCFESACFATIFTLGLRGLGRHTKRGGSWLVAAISGGMVFPPMTGAVVDRSGAHIAMAIPMMGYILAWMYAISPALFVLNFRTNIWQLPTVRQRLEQGDYGYPSSDHGWHRARPGPGCQARGANYPRGECNPCCYRGEIATVVVLVILRCSKGHHADVESKCG